MQLLYFVLLINLNTSSFAMEQNNQNKQSEQTFQQTLVKELLNEKEGSPDLDNNNNIKPTQSLANQCSTLMLLNLPKNDFEIAQLHRLDLSRKNKEKLPKQYSLEKYIAAQIDLKKTEYSERKTKKIENSNLRPQLYIFNLSYIGLKKIPDTIAQLTHLRELNLFYNNLKSLPETIGQLVHLKELNIGRNKLTTLPSSIGKLKELEKLYIAQNDSLTSLPKTMLQLISLVELCGIYYQLRGYVVRTNLSLQSIPEGLENLAHLSKESRDEIKLKRKELPKKNYSILKTQ